MCQIAAEHVSLLKYYRNAPCLLSEHKYAGQHIQLGGKFDYNVNMTFSKLIFFCAIIIAAAYTALSYHPDALFDNSYKQGTISVHSRSPLSASSQAIISKASEKISADEFYNPEQKLDVYLAYSENIHLLLAPFCRKDFSCLHPVTDKIFIAAADLEKNLARKPGEDEYPRLLEGVITHELVKAQLKHTLGALNYFSLSAMKREGYAEHVAQETAGLPPAEICVKNDKRSTLTRYLEQRLALELLRFESDMSYLALLKSGKGNDSAEKSIRRKFCK